ncbi:hypothetical protein [Flavobacterium sp.]|uniref:hypothetical protein n=1 Tax=Flavobacterium sp. TaxID=239 RepID=UPI003C489FC6
MKKISIFLILLIAFANSAYSQIKIEKIIAQDQPHYIVTKIGYPIEGTYLYDGVSEPKTILNANGTGVFQLNDLTKNDISWGIEATEGGIPKFKEGFNSAAYTLWYKKNMDTEENWVSTQFSIHYDKKKIFIAGERSKIYQEEENKIR